MSTSLKGPDDPGGKPPLPPQSGGSDELIWLYWIVLAQNLFLMEVLIAAGICRADQWTRAARAFAAEGDEEPENEELRASMDVVTTALTDPSREPFRRLLRDILKEPVPV